MSDFDLLIKLFDTLKDSSKETQQLCHAMLTNQQNIGNYIKTLPISDLKEALKEHSKESTDEIGTCTETVESKSDIILEEVKEIKGKVTKMILVVIVAFTLFTSAVLIARITTPKPQDTHNELKMEIDNLRKDIEDLHNKK